MSNIETAKAFIAACDSRDVERMVAFFAADGIYHNMPMDPVQGLEMISAVLSGYMDSADEVIFETPHYAESSSGAVLTERLDKFRFGDKWVELPVMGTFEFNADGKITHWRDYFDMNQFQSQMAALSA